MKEISDKDLTNLIKDKFPKLIPYWEDHYSYWGEIYTNDSDENLSIFGDMTPFSLYVIDVIKSGDEDFLKKIFDFVEYLMCTGNEKVKNAIATCFLEFLLNKDPDEIQFITFRQYLGKETIAYCRVWDEFTGVMTKGLHDD